MTKRVYVSEAKSKGSIGRLCTRWLVKVKSSCNTRLVELRHSKVKCMDRAQWRHCLNGRNFEMNVLFMTQHDFDAKEATRLNSTDDNCVKPPLMMMKSQE